MERQRKETGHTGHRERLRNRFANHSAGLQEYELLELLLTYTLPRRDTKPLAKNLLDRFGSLTCVLQADSQQLADVPGFGKSTALFWQLLQELRAREATDILIERPQFSSPKQVEKMVCTRLGHLSKEEFWILLVDNQNKLLDFVHVFSGTVNQTAAYPREILEKALRRHASGIILVHNHPGGNLQPSVDDKVLTQTICKAANALDIRVLDHLIVAGNTSFSFREHGLL